MAKTAYTGFRYAGEKGELESAVRKALEYMDFKNKRKESIETGFLYSAREKRRWLTNNHPVEVLVEAKNSGEHLAVLIEVACYPVSFTQDAHNRQRSIEIKEMILAFALGNTL